MVRAKKKIHPARFLAEFAVMCQGSRAPDGDWQGDGWGIAIKTQSSKLKAQKWDTYKSLRPIWEDRDTFSQFEETDTFVVHARSAGFPEHKGVIAYNQPYVKDGLVFLFNGMIRSVTLPVKVSGTIGAQKIFSLITDFILQKGPDDVLPYIRSLIRGSAKGVEGMNIGLAFGEKLYTLCDYDNNADYFSLRYHQGRDLTMVCSQPLSPYEWRMMGKGEILTL